MPMLRRYGGVPVTSVPLISTRPAEGALNPVTAPSRVDLPEPLGPSRAKNSPGSITRSVSRSATKLP